MQAELQGQVCKNCHPLGCQDYLEQQAHRLSTVANQAEFKLKGKRALILGASSGFGLAARQVLMQLGQFDTLGVFLERPPKGEQLGSAGFYHALFSQQQGQALGLTSLNLNCDAYSPESKERVANALAKLGGPVDLVIYSLAAGARKNAKGELIKSAIKPLQHSIEVKQIDLATDQWQSQQIEPASSEEIEATKAVLGGQDWQQWILYLQQAGLLAKGVRTLAFSYQGPEHSYPLYHHGTLGAAKADLAEHQGLINELLKPQSGQARIAVCKALVTKASFFIPGFVPYLACLSKVLRAKGLEEDCLGQMHRLFTQDWPEQGDIRLDDRELLPEVQQQVKALLEALNDDNWQQLSDYPHVKQELLAMHGFGQPRSQEPIGNEQLLSWLSLAHLND